MALFNSRNPFSTNKPDFSNRMYGANVGGPISKKTSFFLDFEAPRDQDNAIANAVYVDPRLVQSTTSPGRGNSQHPHHLLPRSTTS